VGRHIAQARATETAFPEDLPGGNENLTAPLLICLPAISHCRGTPPANTTCHCTPNPAGRAASP
jgi:hypothetical protein